MSIIALDCDGVLVDYPPAYEIVWERAFGERLTVVDPTAYYATNRYGVTFESPSQMRHFFSHFTDDVWENLPAKPGAVDACNRLSEAGFKLVTVTATDPAVKFPRLKNLKMHSFPINRVIPTGRSDLGFTKSRALNLLQPVALADDLATNFIGLSESIHRALIKPMSNDSPDPQSDVTRPASVHASLAEFVDYWLALGRSA